MASHISLRAGTYEVLPDFLSQIFPYPASMPAKHDIIPDFFIPEFLQKINFTASPVASSLGFPQTEITERPFYKILFFSVNSGYHPPRAPGIFWSETCVYRRLQELFK
jgi:hypothetical protein